MADKALARERLSDLRTAIARMEGKPLHRLQGEERAAPAGGEEEGRALPVGHEALDAVLDGGLPSSGMAEIRAGEMRDSGAATGLALSLSAFVLAAEGAGPLGHLLWIGDPAVMRETGEPFAAGLHDHGLPLERLYYSAPKRLEEALWLAEAALASRAFRMIVLEIAGNPRKFGLSESRRLSLRARSAGSLLLLLRQGGGEEAGSTLFRFSAMPYRSATHRLPDGRPLAGTIGAPAFSVTVEKSPKPAHSLLPDPAILEWNAHERLFARPAPSLPSFGPAPGPAHPGARLPPAGNGPDRTAPLGSVVAFSRAS